MTKNETFAQPGREETAHTPRAVRHSMLIAGRIRSVESQNWEKALCRNLSQGGMRADSAHAWAVGTAVICELRGVGEVPGRIVWVKGKSIGLRFNHPIDPNLVWDAPKDTDETTPHARYLKLQLAPASRPAITSRPGQSKPPRKV